jgi:hypothetical protein
MEERKKRRIAFGRRFSLPFVDRVGGKAEKRACFDIIQCLNLGRTVYEGIIGEGKAEPRIYFSFYIF